MVLHQIFHKHSKSILTPDEYVFDAKSDILTSFKEGIQKLAFLVRGTTHVRRSQPGPSLEIRIVVNPHSFILQANLLLHYYYGLEQNYNFSEEKGNLFLRIL